MKAVVGNDSTWMHMLVWIGLFGLVASFHGIILGYSRQFFALARAGFLPKGLAKLSRFERLQLKQAFKLIQAQQTVLAKRYPISR